MFKRAKNIYRRERFRWEIQKLDNVAILYHHIGDKKRQFENSHTLTLQEFIRHIQFFKKRWRFVGTDEFFEGLRNKSKGLAALTFDDGYLDTFNTALPYLESEGIPYVYYVNHSILEEQFFWRDVLRLIYRQRLVADFLNNTRFSNIDAHNFLLSSKDPGLGNTLDLITDIRDFCSELDLNCQEALRGIYIKTKDLKWFSGQSNGKVGNHTINHPILSTLTKGQIEKEIQGNEDFLENQLPTHCISRSFSTPFGSKRSISGEVIDVLKDLGYKDNFISVPSFYKKGEPMAERIVDTLFCKRILPKSHSI